MQRSYTAEELLKLIAGGHIDFVEGEGDSGSLIITLDGVLESESQSLINALQERPESNAVNEGAYARLVEAVKSHPLYKPRNPRLAILQVAKDNAVSVDELKRVMSESL